MLPVLTNKLWFPPVQDALSDGLLALGGDLSVDRLLLAYQSGIFPWFSESTPLWWSPDPRFVLFPDKLKVSKSMQVLQKKQTFVTKVNSQFEQVMRHCQLVNRPGQDGTWIQEDLIQSFVQLHQMGWAHSYEAWQGNALVGGLYGIKMGRVFFGESMFSRVSNASKYAFIAAVQQLATEGIDLIDCQVYTEHLESLGAEMIPRERFLQYLD
ncbi:MAG: leucyl/phenylalanyl-tRNA--protein transferase [Sphingobacteriia bacterium]|nr:MAG: leucyl/phenylalanyl-tRNA--protein transferase [Sphingobacteriia bacterium]